MKFLSSRQWKMYFIFVGLIAVIAVFITVIVLLPGYLAHEKANKNAAQKKIIKKNLLSAYKIPKEYSTLITEQWKHFYVPERKWKNEDIVKYWVDPKLMALKFLERKNETLVENILDKYD